MDFLAVGGNYPVGHSTAGAAAKQAAGPAFVTPETLAQNRELVSAVKDLNRAELFGPANELTFVLDRNSHRPLLRIVNRETREVIRQIPAEYALQLARELRLPAGYRG